MPRLVIALVSLSACASEPECGLAGDYPGTFQGDEVGSVEIVVSAGEQDGKGFVDYRMTNETLDLAGSTSLECSTGSFVLTLEDPSGAQVGEALGSLGTLNGSGTWSLAVGTDGTWNY